MISLFKWENTLTENKHFETGRNGKQSFEIGVKRVKVAMYTRPNAVLDYTHALARAGTDLVSTLLGILIVLRDMALMKIV